MQRVDHHIEISPREARVVLRALMTAIYCVQQGEHAQPHLTNHDLVQVVLLRDRLRHVLNQPVRKRAEEGAA